MINRILIRIKVVQMLYSYLLTRSEFHIENGPEKNTRDSRYAYSLYLDLLLIILELSGYRVRVGNERNPMEALGAANMLAGGKLPKALSTDISIRDIINKGNTGIEAFDPALMRIYSAITSCAAYTDFRKIKKAELADEVKFWVVVLNTIVAKDPTFIEIARSSENFTQTGYNRAFEMVTHTLNDFNDTRATLTQATNSLNESLEKAYELYNALLILPVAITDVERERLQAAKEKYRPTHEDLNPNTRFVDNAYVEAIRNHPGIEEYSKKRPISWEGDYYMLKDLLDKIKSTKEYADYMEAPSTDFANDCEFWRTMMKNVILPSDALAETLETKSVYWNDDLAIMGTFVLKTIRQIARNYPDTTELLPIYKDEDDAKFGPKLFLDAIKNRDTYRSYIDRFINGSQWDPDRLAFMDIVILLTAISELINFPSIPIPVTLNEYIEIANYYSTPRSGQFINGLLYNVVNYLQQEGIITKQ